MTGGAACLASVAAVLRPGPAGGSGIGKETAARFVAEGASVVINGRSLEKLEAAAHEIDPTGRQVAVSAGDIADPATGAALVDTAVSRFGKLDLTDQDYDWYLDTILKGKFFTAQAAAKAMKETGVRQEKPGCLGSHADAWRKLRVETQWVKVPPGQG